MNFLMEKTSQQPPKLVPIIEINNDNNNNNASH